MNTRVDASKRGRALTLGCCRWRRGTAMGARWQHSRAVGTAQARDANLASAGESELYRSASWRDLIVNVQQTPSLASASSRSRDMIKRTEEDEKSPVSSYRISIEFLRRDQDAQNRVISFFGHRNWSVATAAMLISDMLPPAGCTKIPEEASRLLDPSLPADQRRKSDANKVVSRWEWEHDESEGPVPTEVEPIEFLEWAGDSIGIMSGPSLLAYFLRLIGRLDVGPVDLDVVDRLLDLEDLAVSKKNDEVTEHVQRKDRFQRRMDFLVGTGEIRAKYANEIAIALDQSSRYAIFQPQLIWLKMLEMARSKKYSTLRVAEDDPNSFEIPGGRDWTVCSPGLLGQFITRNRHLLLKEEQTGGQAAN